MDLNGWLTIQRVLMLGIWPKLPLEGQKLQLVLFLQCLGHQELLVVLLNLLKYLVLAH